MATKLRSLQQTYNSLKGKGNVTSHLSSYAKSLATKTQAAEDKIVDDNYANGLITTQAYLDALNTRSTRATLTPAQRVSLKIKIRDTQQAYTDEQIQTAYKTGGFYNGQKVDDAAMLAYEKSKLAGMVAGSTAYEQEVQKVAALQDKVDKAARTEYRLQTQLQLSQSPDANWQIMQQKADMYQKLADEAKADGDNNQYMTFQTTANNYKESATNAKVSAEYQDKVFKAGQKNTQNKQNIKYGDTPTSNNAPTTAPVTAGSGLAGGNNNTIPNNPTAPAAPESVPTQNPDGTITPGTPATETPAITEDFLLEDLLNTDWNNISNYYTPEDIKSMNRGGKALENKKKAIDTAYSNYEAAMTKAEAAGAAMDASTTYDSKLKYAREQGAAADLANGYLNEYFKLQDEYAVDVTDVTTAEAKTNTKVAQRIFNDKVKSLDEQLSQTKADFTNGKINLDTMLAQDSLITKAKGKLLQTKQEVFRDVFDDPTVVDAAMKDYNDMESKGLFTKAENEVVNPGAFAGVIDPKTGVLETKDVSNLKMSFGSEDKVSDFDKLYQPVVRGGEVDENGQPTNVVYMPVEYRSKDGTNTVLPLSSIKSTSKSELEKNYQKVGYSYMNVPSASDPKKTERAKVAMTFAPEGNASNIDIVDANGKVVRNVWNLPEGFGKEQSTVEQLISGIKQTDFGKVVGNIGNTIGSAINSVGDFLLKDKEQTASMMPAGPIQDFFRGDLLRSTLQKAPAAVDQLQDNGSALLRSMNISNPFEIQKVYAQGMAGEPTPTLTGVPAQYSDKIIQAANKYNINPSTLAGLLAQESWDFADKYVSGYHTDGTGRGIAAIDKTWHPEVTDEQAFDPNFAIDWAAKEFSRLQTSKGSEFDALRAYNAGEAGTSSNPSAGKVYANKVLERAKNMTLATPETSKPTVAGTSTGLRSQNPDINYAGTLDSGSQLGPQPAKKTSSLIASAAPVLRSQSGGSSSSSKPKSSGGNIVQQAAKAVSNVSNAVKSNPVYKAIDSVSTPQKAANTVLRSAVSNAPKIISTGLKVANTVNNVKTGVSNAVNSVKSAVSNTYNDIKKKASNAVSGLKSFLKWK